MNPFFPVEFQPLTTPTGASTNKLALVNVNSNKILGTVSKKYKIIKNESVTALFDEALPFATDSVSDHMLNGGEVWRRRIVFSKDVFGFEILPDDVTGIMLELFNSYNGKTSYGYTMMGYRWKCTNGQVFGKRKLFSDTFSHMRNMIEVIRASFDQKFEMAQEMIKLQKSWTEVSFTLKDMKRFVETRNYLSDKAKERVLETYEGVLLKENLNDTRYGAYNSLTNMFTHSIKSTRKDSSPIFARSAHVYETLTNDFINYEIAA